MRWTLLGILVAACGGPEESPPDIPPAPNPAEAAPDPLTEKLRNAAVTDARPEVGRINGCTATLVAPDVAITAAHCVDYGTRENRGRYNTLRLSRDGEERRFTVDRYKSFSRTGPNENDIALLGLAEPVPADFATPAPIAEETPPGGASMTVYGYGCTRIGTSTDWKKRRATFAQGERAQFLCPGDSGGPVFHDELGAIARINSGIIHDPGYTDIYALVPPMHGRLIDTIRAWSAGPVPQIGAPAPPDPEVKVCGRGLEVFPQWTCTGPGRHRYLCVAGGTPTWEECAQGCERRPGAEPDVCAGLPAPTPDDVNPPAVRLVSPSPGVVARPGERVTIEALVHDDGALAGVHLLWAYNRQAYACPSSSGSVDCVVDGATYRWSVQLDGAGPRGFQVRARDAGGNEQTTKPLLISVVDPPAPEAGPEPEPAPEDPPPEGAPPPEEPPAAPEPRPEGPDGLPRPPPPNAPGAPNRPDQPPADEDNGVPTIELVEPDHGAVFGTNVAVDIVARITDAEGIAGADLWWGYNDNRYGCPSQSQSVNCVVEGDVRRWTVSLGGVGPRPFTITARNSRARVTTTPERVIDVRSDPNARAPDISLVSPGPDTVWRAREEAEVVARIRDDGRVTEATLLWEHNGKEYACPGSYPYVECEVGAGLYTWRIQVGTGARAFQVRAVDDQGNQTLTPRRSVRLR